MGWQDILVRLLSRSAKDCLRKWPATPVTWRAQASAGPILGGLIGSKVALNNGQVITADENYVRESIMNPQAKVVAGFQPIMPNFNGVLTQDQVNSLIAYVKTIKGGPSDQGQVSAAATAGAGTAPAGSSVIPAVQDAPSTQTASQPAAPAPAAPAAPKPAAIAAPSPTPESKPAPAPVSTNVGNNTSSNAAGSSASVKADATPTSGSAAGSTVK